MKIFFVTGTDTGIGKTYCSVRMLKYYQQLGYAAQGIKTIATGCEIKNGLFMNDDALLLQRASSVKLNEKMFESGHLPQQFAFVPAIAPHIAAEKENRPITVTHLHDVLSPILQQRQVDVMLFEGAGGWRVPLNDHETWADFVKSFSKYHQQELQVILVVGIRLGCINQALLTTEIMQHDGISLAGWIANCIDPDMAYQQENIDFLKSKIAAPCLDVVSFKEIYEISGFIFNENTKAALKRLTHIP